MYLNFQQDQDLQELTSPEIQICLKQNRDQYEKERKPVETLKIVGEDSKV